jgi:glutamyl-tRNA reductase
MERSCPALHNFCIVGVNHWDARIEVRERFSLSEAQIQRLIDGARREGIDSLFAVSTCNRTEIISNNSSSQDLIRLLITYSRASLDEFHTYGFEKKGSGAIEHLFRVALGLDSQILGDVQVINQVKQGYKLASELDTVDGELHKLMQHVFRAHKRSRNETTLGEGAASTAYAAIRFALNTFETLVDKHILLVGTGKIGKITCENLVNLGAAKVTLANRTLDRAEVIARRFDFDYIDMEDLPGRIADAQLIIVATDAQEPVITLNEMGPAISEPHFKVFLDLSVPRNVDPQVGRLNFVDVANMDYLSDVTDKAYRKREENIPKVKEIIVEELNDYKHWLRTQKVVPTIKALTQKFEDIRQDEFDFFKNKIKETDSEKVEYLTRRIVNKIAAYSIEHLRDHHESDRITQVVSEMFKLETHVSDE